MAGENGLGLVIENNIACPALGCGIALLQGLRDIAASRWGRAQNQIMVRGARSRLVASEDQKPYTRGGGTLIKL